MITKVWVLKTFLHRGTGGMTKKGDIGSFSAGLGRGGAERPGGAATRKRLFWLPCIISLEDEVAAPAGRVEQALNRAQIEATLQGDREQARGAEGPAAH